METQNVNVNEIHCKVQYGNEIRRFLLQGSYQVMLAQIREYFGFKVDEEINVKYTDDEGDLVTISSDEELVFAADLFASGVLRLNVTLSDSEPGKSACGKWARKGCGRWGQAEGSCGKWGLWGQSEGSCGKWGQSEESCGKWGQRADGCGRWARNGNECDKWAKMRAERAECWKAKKAQKSANKCHAKGEKKMEKWEAKSAKKAQKWEDKAAKKVNKAEKWEAKRARWEEKKEKILADPELRKSKIEHIDSKLAKLQQRKQCMQTRVDAKENPWFAQRLEFLNHKMARLESFRASLANPQNSTPTPVVVQEYTFPPNQPFREVRY